jgi:hypothetical protein
MRATVIAGVATRDVALAAFEREGCSPPRSWGNGRGEEYGWHEHPRAKVLFCLAGSIVFRTEDGNLPLHAGDRLDLPAATRHAATVGPDGCECIEAWGA